MNINLFLDDMKYDTRLIEKNIQNGIVKKADYEAHLKSLSDQEHNSQILKLDDGVAEEVETPEVAEEVVATPSNPIY